DIEDLDECDRIYGDNESDGQALKQLFYPNYFSNDPMERELPHRILQLLNEKESVDSIDALIKEAKGMQAVDLTGPDPTRRTIFKALQAKGLEVTPEYLDQIFPRDRTQTLN
ncbi:MAG: hypothetical protein KDD15_32710, partial [Lewinella sp.]|nr:hypothetical protein [Lewinella sp.]